MKVWAKVEDIEAEVTVRAPFSPDVLHELCNRVSELILTQRVADPEGEEEQAGGDAKPPLS